MVSWIARISLYAAGVVTGWFIARDAPNFGLFQMVTALLLLTLFVFIMAFWPARWGRKRTREHSEHGPGASS